MSSGLDQDIHMSLLMIKFDKFEKIRLFDLLFWSIRFL
jgi:hypothetical protein